LNNHGLRKLSSEKGMRSSPTKHEDWIVLRGDDLRLKERVTVCVTGAGAG